MDDSAFSQRVEVLWPLTQYGPDYNRNVVAALADARLFHRRNEPEAAEHFLLLAETRAGLYTFEEFKALDPYLPC